MKPLSIKRHLRACMYLKQLVQQLLIVPTELDLQQKSLQPHPLSPPLEH